MSVRSKLAMIVGVLTIIGVGAAVQCAQEPPIGGGGALCFLALPSPVLPINPPHPIEPGPIRPFPKPIPRPWPFPHPFPPLPLPLPIPVPDPEPGPPPDGTGGAPGDGTEGWGSSYSFVPLGGGDSAGWVQVTGTYTEAGEVAVVFSNPSEEPIHGGLQVVAALAYTQGWYPDYVTEFADGEYVPVDLGPGESQLHVLGRVGQGGLDLLGEVLATLYTAYNDPEPGTDYVCLGVLTAVIDEWVPWVNLYVPILEPYVDASS